MGMTITEKILAAHAGRNNVTAGENVWVDVDILMTHDVCGPGTIGVFKEQFGDDAKVWDPEKIVIIPDHYIFTADTKAHRNIEILREFVKEQNIKYYYDPAFVKDEGMPKPYRDPKKTSYKGVCHVALPEEGHTRPGEILLGTDSHTCTAGAFGELATGIGNTDAGFVMGTGKLWLKVPPTMRFIFDGEVPEYLMAKDLILTIIGDIGTDGATYCAMEFSGEGVMDLNIDERMTLCNMAIEAGGKNGIIPVDEKVREFVESKTDKPWNAHANDPDARFKYEKVYQTPDLEPTVAKPHAPGNREPARNLKNIKVDRAYIGSCTGGKTTDFIAAARILKGREVRIPTFIVPATTEVHVKLKTECYEGVSLENIFQDAGCLLGPASCAACLGGPEDTFGRANEALRCVSTTNRNFPGRMGSKDAEIFLASPYTAAASAVTGCITDPREVLS
ncbi:MAG: 3-isopropylmalate dehydratase large subunit [Planctomycetota bacterium]|nr:MAG: 3-isopropylmalate dehydratase large subunit [Planctomycetota bacterium]